MTLEQRVKALAKKYKISPRREQGQHFVIQESVLEDMVEAANLTAHDTVIEIGPGFGTLTMALAEKAESVIAIEQDRELIEAVVSLTPSYPNIHPVQKDAREANLPQLLDELAGHDTYKLVSNLPYNITSWVLRHYLENEPRPEQIVLLIQKEVAERATAKPGNMSVLSVAVQLYSSAEIVTLVQPEAFWPEPAVQSAIISLTDIQAPEGVDAANVMRIAKIGFASKRKQLKNNLANGLNISQDQVIQALEKNGLKPSVRAQELALEDWKSLSQIFA